MDDLGTKRLSWRDLWVIVQRLPQTSALARSLSGEDALWGLTDHLLAMTFDAVQFGNWQRAGNKNAARPKPIPRPGAKSDGKRFGSAPIPIKDFNDWWENGG